MNVSIVTVCFNAADTIAHTIRSVLDQKYEHIEYVIVDGGSTDGTIDVVKKYDGRIKTFISEPDRGIYDAMNKGVRLAHGDIIAFLNADDVYASPTVISDVVTAMYADHSDGVYGDLVYVGRRNTNRVVRYWQAGEYRPRAFRSGWVPPHPTFFCLRDMYRQFGGFDPAYRIAGDFELMLRFIEKHRIRVQYVPKPFVYMRAGGRGNTLRGIIQGNREIIQAFHRNNIVFPPGFFLTKFLRKALQVVGRPSVDLIR